MSWPDIESGLYSKLHSHAPLAAWAGTVNTLPQIYQLMAPAGAVLPYVRFYDAVTLTDAPHDAYESVYRVEAIAGSVAATRTGAEHIYDALHGQALSLTGHESYWMYVTRKQDFTELAERDIIYRRVFDVQIRIRKVS